MTVEMAKWPQIRHGYEMVVVPASVIPANRLCQSANVGVRKATPSFPRKRESRGGEGQNGRVSPPYPTWIPAFAGMTEWEAGMT